MKIGIYLGDIKKPNSVGDLTFELSFVEELLKQDTAHEFVFYYFGQKQDFKEQENARFVNLKYYKKPQLGLNPISIKFYKTPYRSLNHRLKKDNINAVFFLTPYLHEHIEIPYFAAIRDVAHRILPHFPEFSTNSVFERMDKKLNLFLTGATRILTCNHVVKNDIIALYDVIDENTEVINLPYPNWIEKTKEDKNFLKWNDLSKNNYIYYPAQFWSHKNHIRLILAAQIMKEQNINLKVVFSGLDRGNKKYLINQVEKLDLQEKVIFLDYVNQKQMASLYKNAYALVYPSLAGPDTISALEALYFNCPVLISNHLGYTQQLKKAALYFNPLDEMDIVAKIQNLNDLAIKDDLINKGQAIIKENTMQKYIDKFLNIMDSFYLTRQCWSLEESYLNK
ncbi:MAG: glycosyltransferase family 4 protein [Candidatus Gastranaerophilales bacterium]|nr:glycosyltransferase family 4 protein [Candidatus Gastranaerophilales bacterium]